MGSKRFSTTLTQENADSVRSTLKKFNAYRAERDMAEFSMSTFVAQAINLHARGIEEWFRAGAKP